MGFMKNDTIRIGTRKSPLAVWQAELVQTALQQAGYQTELVLIKSEGDVDLVTPLYEMGIQGIFTKAADTALLNHQIDIAVHSLKDVPTMMASGIVTAAVLKRDSPLDILVVKNNLTVLIQETKTEIISDSLPHINASMTEMSQLFQNIIANAIKFRKTHEVPRIIVKTIENNSEYIISIEDNGIGIKKEYQERVFTLFQRLHSRDAYEGSGIGLATCKKIIDNMGGRMWLTSTEGLGTTFYFTIPKGISVPMSSSTALKLALVA